MKRYFFIIITILTLSCDDDKPVNNNPFIRDYSFSTSLNLNLPTYNVLKFISNPILIDIPGVGIKGVIVMKAGENDYRAFEASCPNQTPSDCTKLTINGINAKCPCDSKEYSIYTGLATGVQYPLKAYRTELNGDNLRVYN
jgi:nitrite reductase/ring-hydroxylating ferredoxin subunit